MTKTKTAKQVNHPILAKAKMKFVSLSDVFRNGKPLDRTFPGPHNQAEIVEASDYRVTYYIPQNAINAYPGTLTQNPTDNSGVILN